MEWLALSNEELTRLAQEDPTLAPYFVGVFASDRLPASPHRQGPQAYVVNTDPHGRPGQHWLALWTPGDDAIFPFVSGRCHFEQSLSFLKQSLPFITVVAISVHAIARVVTILITREFTKIDQLRISGSRLHI